MISSILMKDVASYRGEGVTFEGMDKVNFIFGSNGTGKTTISSFMKDYSGYLETGAAVDGRFTQCGVTWADDSRQKILVYNRQFKKENIGQSSIPGVFIMGKDAVDNAKEIENLEKILADKITAADNLRTQASTLRSSVLPGGGIYKAYFEKAGEKIYNEATSHYDDTFKNIKRDYVKRLERIIDAYNRLTTVEVLSEEKLKEHISIANQATANPIPELKVPDISPITEIEKDTIWSKAVVGSGDLDFAGFINDINLSDWVKKGMEKLPQTGDVCPFCQQHTITSSIIEKLNSYFDESYEKDIETIRRLTTTYERKAIAIIETIRTLEQCEYVDSQELDKMTDNLENLIRRNLTQMRQKIDFPSCKVDMEDCTPVLKDINGAISMANTKIVSRNNLIVQKRKIKSALPQRVLEFFVKKYEADIEAYVKEKETALIKAQTLDSELEKTNTEINDIDQKISDLRAQSSDSTAVVERINKVLIKHNYKSFHLENFDDSSYRIVRKNGEDASETLSEGEETLITFLYYLQLLEGSTVRGKDSGELIAVIDDPISSLDNNILTFIAREIKDLMFKVGQDNMKLKQLIILTHNINFHKSLAKGPVYGSNTRGPQKAYYILEKSLGTENTIVRKPENSGEVESEYNEMWNLLKRAYSKLNSDNTEEENRDYKYTIQNTMRRIYETFFSNTCGMRDQEIVKLFEHKSRQYKSGDCRNLIEWLNEGSHSVSLSSYNDLPSDEIIKEYLAIFEEMFRVTGNIGQFKKLMG